jgi:hypothetical protein
VLPQDVGEHVYGIIRRLDVAQIQPDETERDQEMLEYFGRGAAGKLEGDEDQDEDGGHDEVALPPGSFKLFPEGFLHVYRYLVTNL